MRGRRKLPAPVSGTRPRFTKIQPSLARSLAMRTSAWVANSTPIPTAAPSMAAITGFGHWTMGHGVRARWSSLRDRVPRWSSGVSSSSDRSVPAQNAPPAPVMITARAASSSAARQTAAVKSARTA